MGGAVDMREVMSRMALAPSSEPTGVMLSGEQTVEVPCAAETVLLPADVILAGPLK